MGKSKFEKAFTNLQSFDSDVYMADYTLQTNSAKKVVIQNLPFDDIAYFHLENEPSLELLAVNFERNKGFFPSGVRDCESLLKVKNVNDGWFLLCELKYCLEKNISNNADSAYRQLVNTWQLLVGRKLLNAKRSRSYFNIAVPDHSEKAPFSSFIATQDDQIKWRKKHKIHLLGHNDVLVVNEGILIVPQMKV